MRLIAVIAHAITWAAVLVGAEAQSESDLPPTANQVGNSGWLLLHTVSIAYPDQPTEEQKQCMMLFLTSFSKVYPCAICAEHLQKELAADPPKVNSRTELAQWMCRLHNKVNLQLNKPAFPCDKVFTRWDGTAKLEPKACSGLGCAGPAAGSAPAA